MSFCNMSTDDDKIRTAKLLEGLEVPDIRLSERCLSLVKDFHEKFDKYVEEEEMEMAKTINDEVYENPYKKDQVLLQENERKLSEVLMDLKRTKKSFRDGTLFSESDPKRPWRTNSNKERLLRINHEIKNHHEKGSQLICPMDESAMKNLIQECEKETSTMSKVAPCKIRESIDDAKKSLPNFQYRKIDNSTATIILPAAHDIISNRNNEINVDYMDGISERSGQYIPRPETRQCFLRSLGELRNLRVLALEYAYIADTTGGALISLLPIMKKPHFKLQLICREESIPGCTDAALGAGGHVIPDTAWRRVAIACPDIYVLMAFHRVRDYDNIRRFLTPSIPLRETHMQYGIDLFMKQRQDSDISCFIRHIAFRYANSLVTLSLHQWRFANFPLRRVFELMPRLVRFYYVGRVEDDIDLRRLLHTIACGVYDKLRHIMIQIQDEDSKREYWDKAIVALIEEYKDVMDLYDIKFCFNVYKI